MKTKPTISEIAEKLSVSKTTVSKALNNKPGLKQETKDKIINYANLRGYTFPDIDKTDIVIMLPVRYKNLCSSVQKQCRLLKLSARCGVYNSENEYLKFIKGIYKIKPKITAIYPISPLPEEEIKKLSQKFSIWFIGDILNIENTFYFGTNPISEAEKLSESFIASGCANPLFIHSRKSIINSIRTKKFAENLKIKKIYPSGQIFCNKISSSLLAHTIEKKKSRSFDSIYFGDELCEFSESALSKLSIKEIPVFKYDDAKTLINNIFNMLIFAKDYIENKNYPPCKYNF